MFGSESLEVAIGVIFIYWLLSLISSTLNEMVATLFSFRAKDLEKAIRNLLNDPKGLNEAKSFYEHSIITALKNGKRNPSYIPAHTFSMVLSDIVTKSGISMMKGEDLRGIVNGIANDKLKQSLLTLVDSAGSRGSQIQEGIEKWFNDTMERVSGWYKRKTQIVISVIAFALVLIFNADTFMIVKNLVYMAPVRTAIVAQAEGLLKEHNGEIEESTNNIESSIAQIKEFRKDLLSLPLPLGWTEYPQSLLDWIKKVMGLLFSVVAVSLGAPFWFEFMEKLLKVRLAQTGKRPEKES